MPATTLTKSLRAAIPLCETLEDAITLTKAADFVPSRPHCATIWRWATKGCRGIKLQTWLLGGKRVTTPAALEEFLQKLNADSSADEADPGLEGDRRSKAAGKALEALGC